MIIKKEDKKKMAERLQLIAIDLSNMSQFLAARGESIPSAYIEHSIMKLNLTKNYLSK